MVGIRILGRILPLLFWIFIIFGFDTPSVAVLTLIAAVIHEGGHILTAGLFGVRRGAPLGVMSGMRIRLFGCTSYRARILILLAGPFANIAAALFTPFIPLPRDYLSLFAMLNIATALSNLLPSEGYDGYGALYALFESSGIEWGLRLLPRLSLFVSVLLSFFSLYLIGRVGRGYWIFGVFFSSLIAKLSKSIERGVF